MTDNSLMTDEYIKNMRLLSWILFSELKDVKLSTYESDYDLWELDKSNPSEQDKDIKNNYTFDPNEKYIKNENNEIIKGYQKDYIEIKKKLYHKKVTSKYSFFKYKIIRNIQDFNNFKFRQDAIYYFNNFYLKINENKETLETEDGDINKNKKDDLISYYIDYSNLKDYEIIINMIVYFSIYNIDEDKETLKKFVSKNLKNDKIDFNEKANDKYLGKPLFKNSLYIMDIIAILSTILLMFFIYFIKEDYNTNVYIVSGILIIIAIIYVFFSILLYN